MNKIGAVLCICVLLLSGCGGKDNEFVVEGTINNLGGRPIYLLAQLLVSSGSHSRCRNVPFCRPRLQQLFILLIELKQILICYFVR